jgi:micrococcal nuclease
MIVRHRRCALPAIALMAVVAVSGCAGSPEPPSATQLSTAGVAQSTAEASAVGTPFAVAKPLPAPTGPIETAKVVRIVDGDTIVVSIKGKSFKVRYIGMDTPEDVDPNSPVEPMSREAAAANAKLVNGKTVVLEKDVSETDQYGRLLRYVWLHDGSKWTLVNLVLVQRGLALALRYPPDVKYADLFSAAESTARSSLLGLFGLTASASAAVTPKPTPRPTSRPTPKPTPRPAKVASKCHPSYRPCLPIVADLECPDVRAMGLAPVRVIGPDDYRLDRDHDGIGCE